MSVELPSGLFVAEDWDWEREFGCLVPYEEPQAPPEDDGLRGWLVDQGLTVKFLDGTEWGLGIFHRVLREVFSTYQARMAADLFQPSPFHAWIAKSQV